MRKAAPLPANWSQPEEITTYLRFVKERGCQPTTLRIYRGRLNRTAYWLLTERDTILLAATVDDLGAWRSSLRHSTRTETLYIGVIRAYYAWAKRMRHIEFDPAYDLPRPRYRRSVPRPVDDATMFMAVESAPPMIRMWLLLAAYCGLRAAEIAGLRREDIHANGGAPYMIILGKGEKERVVPLSPQLWDELCLYGMPARGELFRRKDGRPFTPNHLDILANRYLHDLGIPETLHQFRHWFGTIGQQEIGDLVVLAKVMGHSSTNTTAGYAEPSMEKARDMVTAIATKYWPANQKDPRTPN